MTVRHGNSWASIVVDLMREQKATQRGLALSSGVSRSCLRKIIDPNTTVVNVALLEKVLNKLGYDLDIVSIGGK